MKRNNKSRDKGKSRIKEKIKEPSEEEYEEEEEEYEEEEEEEEEVTIRKPNKGLRKNSNGDQEILDVDEDDSDEDDSEQRNLTKEVKAAVRLSEVSSKKNRGSKNHITTNSGDILLFGRQKLSFKEKLIKWFKSRWFSLFMIMVTGWTMISEDLRLLGPKAIDPLMYSLIIL